MAEFPEPKKYRKLIDQGNLGVSTGSTYPSDQRIKYLRTSEEILTSISGFIIAV